jgi:maltose alpha-D-glucosyltransferase/alpha-amylase
MPEASRVPGVDAFATYLPYAEILGRRTGQMHLALATPTDDPAFSAEDLTEADMAAEAAEVRELLARALASLSAIEPYASPAALALIEAFRKREEEIVRLIERLAVVPKGARKTRIHGDYRLGQVLIVQNDVSIVGFAGPSRLGDRRRAKSSPLRDVAGMLRSFHQAAATTARELAARLPEAEGKRVLAASGEWLAAASRIFLEAYRETVGPGGEAGRTGGAMDGLLRFYLLAHALTEICEEAGSRLDGIETPLQATMLLMDEGRT